eukprot:CAMPEP_0205827292 /NCGR_PEP_ID=MMETSP0206-20130828/31491_1 /ASSEMBLY_ACC=CAM_ASM_000279 /TAXON_ID=36767 /ORGANISM="Euplotes focardii, Strain TN1" /LENGTH=216 /DNA_ID=CAMNT_0053128057 /DNA_START=30 /DNA_END=680 /DNA_ORIENTATION=+
MNQMLIVPLILMGLNQLGLDYTDPATVLNIRVAYVSAQCLTFLMFLFVYIKIRAKMDDRKLEVPKEQGTWEKMQAQAKEAQEKAERERAIAEGQPTEEESAPVEKELREVTFATYDTEELKKLVKMALVGVGITCLLHFKWEIIQPLVIQSVLGPLKLVDHALFKLHVLGAAETDKLVRPFKVDDPNAMLKGLMGQSEEETPAPKPKAKKRSKKTD